MKKLITICMLLFTSACTSTSESDSLTPLRDMPMPPVEARFPISHNATAIENAYTHPNDFDGESVSVEGKITVIDKLNNSLPTITIRIEPSTEIMLINSTQIEGSKFMKIGMQIRAMGYLRKTSDMVALLGSKANNEKPLSMMSICIVQSTTFEGIFDGKYMELCSAWQKGLKIEPLS